MGFKILVLASSSTVIKGDFNSSANLANFRNMDNKISLDCDTIVSYGMSWEEAKQIFDINSGNLQKVYIRYIIKKYGLKTAERLLCEPNKGQSKG